MNLKKYFCPKTIAIIGLLVAMEIVLNRFLSFNQWNLKIGFNFIPIVVCAYLFGPIPAGIVAGLGDFLGAILFPIGPYFPGFTLTAFLTGIVFGIFLHKYTFVKQIVGVIINQAFFALLLNTFWISIVYGSSFFAVLIFRIPQALVMSALQIFVIAICEKVLFRRLRHVVG